MARRWLTCTISCSPYTIVWVHERNGRFVAAANAMDALDSILNVIRGGFPGLWGRLVTRDTASDARCQIEARDWRAMAQMGAVMPGNRALRCWEGGMS